jgi:hypothetical protein
LRLCAGVQGRSEISTVAATVREFPAELSTTHVARRLLWLRFEVAIMRVPVWLGGVFLLSVLPVNGGEQLRMAVSPSLSFAPSTLRIRVRLEPNDQNRGLAVIADSGGFYRSSEVQLDGEQAPRTITIEFRGVPSGSYQISSVVLDESGRRRASASQDVNVIPSVGQ